jgi:capsular polysaccharide biosynthesis protein
MMHIDAFVQDRPNLAGCIRISPEEQGLAPAPRFMFGPCAEHVLHSLFAGHATAALGCYVLRGGRLGYDAALSHGETALWSLGFNHGYDDVKDILARHATVSLRHVRGQAACIHGPGYGIFGHWLVDFLPRLSLLGWAGYDIRKLSYILPYDLPEFAYELLRLSGVTRDRLIPYDPAREQIAVDELVVPTNLRTGNRLHSRFAAATQEWVRRILPEQQKMKPDRRLFISRRHCKSGRVLGNRAEIEALAMAAGFELVHPESLKLIDQIALFRGARQIVGEYGSGLHGTIYGAPSLHCCALRGTSHWLGFIQSGLAQAAGQSMSYVFGHADTHAVDYTFTIDPGHFRIALECLHLELR